MSSPTGLSLRNFITCPHCWSEFPVDQVLWVSESSESLGDIRLGEAAQQRFLPTRFDARGLALDSAGFACNKLACPHCHLVVPRPFLEIPPYFVSIVGAPASGKSYFLASMIWKLRQTLPAEFGLAFSDADPELNLRLHQYESTQFISDNSDQLVALEKTEVYGSWYSTVLFNDQRISYPQPFVFSMVPMSGHPHAGDALRYSHLLSLYDNAGESYLPGADAGTHPVTRHLTQSHAIFFLYDPTQDHRFRAACRGKSNDPQLAESLDGIPVHRSPMRQDTIFTEMAKRIRQQLGLPTGERTRKPLYVVVTKLDAWSHLLGEMDWSVPWKRVKSRDPANLIVMKNADRIQPVLPQQKPKQAEPEDEFGFADDLKDFFGINHALETPSQAKPEQADEKTPGKEESPKPFRSALSGFSTRRVEEVSDRLRELLLKIAPEIVRNAEQFAEEVRFIPISATGLAPSIDPKSGILGFRPKDISPIWAEVPILYALAKSTRGIVPVLQPKKER